MAKLVDDRSDAQDGMHDGSREQLPPLVSELERTGASAGQLHVPRPKYGTTQRRFVDLCFRGRMTMKSPTLERPGQGVRPPEFGGQPTSTDALASNPEKRSLVELLGIRGTS